MLDNCICGGFPVIDDQPLGQLEPWSDDWQMGFPMGPEYYLTLEAPPAFWMKRNRDEWHGKVDAFFGAYDA